MSEENNSLSISAATADGKSNSTASQSPQQQVHTRVLKFESEELLVGKVAFSTKYHHYTGLLHSHVFHVLIGVQVSK